MQLLQVTLYLLSSVNDVLGYNKKKNRASLFCLNKNRLKLIADYSNNRLCSVVKNGK